MLDYLDAETICSLYRQCNINYTFQVIGCEGQEPTIICLTSDPISKIKNPKTYEIKSYRDGDEVPCYYIVSKDTGAKLIDFLRVTPIKSFR